MNLLTAYLQRIRQAVEDIPNAAVDFYLEQLFSAKRANLRFRLHWPSGAIVEVSEAVVMDAEGLVWLSYRYHFQEDTYVLRYDNAPHHPHLPTHPDHKHQSTELSASPRPDLEDFLREIRAFTEIS